MKKIKLFITLGSMVQYEHGMVDTKKKGKKYLGVVVIREEIKMKNLKQIFWLT